jgi:hypothetical protein
MPARIQHESGNLFRIDVSGVLRLAELKNVQIVAAEEIARCGRIALLFVLDTFEGWERGADWGDLSFYTEHDQAIDKIAIVGDEKWRDDGLAFAGAGIRKAAVRFYLPMELARARAWLLQDDQPVFST